jgi:hypothetical protein
LYERHAEYRYKPSSIHGKLRSAASGSLDAWHLSQFFSSRPSLSLGFVQDQPPFDRVVRIKNLSGSISEAEHNRVKFLTLIKRE